MPAKKESLAGTKRSRSPAATDADCKEATECGGFSIPPATWAHTPATDKDWDVLDDSLLFLDLYSGGEPISVDGLGKEEQVAPSGDGAEKKAPAKKKGKVAPVVKTHCRFEAIRKAEKAAKLVKVAAFDMDDTLIAPGGGKVFAVSRRDWFFVHEGVAEKLRALHQANYRIVIFSNQSGIGGGKEGWDTWKEETVCGKIVDIGNALSIPISAWVAACDDNFRKPNINMWEHFTARLPYPVDTVNSFYCGDAAGRSIPTLANRKKDFSCSDRKFAVNIKLPFFTPEMYFAGMNDVDEKEVDWDGISAAELSALPRTYPQKEYHQKNKGGLDCVIFTGYPGCGKSTFFRRFFAKHKYFHINRDKIKDAAKCQAAAKEALAAGKSVVIDNTSPSEQCRKPYLDLAEQFNATARSIHFTASKEMANHMNIVRARLNISPRVSSVAYHVFKGKHQPPSKHEGFAELITVPPVVDFASLPDGAEEAFFMLS